MMPRKPESIFSDKVIATLRLKFGNQIWIENIQQKSKVGTPDLLACLKGRFVAMELKVDGGVVAPLQMVKLLEIQKAKGRSFIVTPDNFDEVIDNLVNIF